MLALALRDTVGWRGVWIIIGLGGLAVFAASFRLPESPRWLVTHGRGDEALDQLERMGLGRPPAGEALVADTLADIRSDPMAVVFRRYRGRIIAAMICFFAFFSAAVGLGGWLPNILAERGFTITKSLTFVFAIQLAFPASSLLMMYALERYGRVPTAVTAFVLATILSILFYFSRSAAMVLAVGFGMTFFTQLAGNSMQIFTSEVFPSNARASGFGLAQAGGRIGAAAVVSGYRHRQRLWLWLCDGGHRGDAGGRGLCRDLDRRRDPRVGARHDRADHRVAGRRCGQSLS